MSGIDPRTLGSRIAFGCRCWQANGFLEAEVATLSAQLDVAEHRLRHPPAP